MKINLDNSDRIINDYMPLILAVVRRFPAFEKEESIDEAKMVVIDTIMDYKEEKGAFGAYLKLRLNYYFFDKAKKPTVTSLDKENGEGDSLISTLESDIDIEKEFFTKEKYQDLYQKIRKLKKRDQKIIIMKYFQNKTNTETGDILKISEKTVRNRHSQIIKELKTMFLDS